MNQNKKPKKNYISPQIKVIEVELESCFNSEPLCLTLVNNDENKHLLEKLKVIT